MFFCHRILDLINIDSFFIIFLMKKGYREGEQDYFCHSGCSGSGMPESHGENPLYEIPAFAGMTEGENLMYGILAFAEMTG